MLLQMYTVSVSTAADIVKTSTIRGALSSNHSINLFHKQVRTQDSGDHEPLKSSPSLASFHAKLKMVADSHSLFALKARGTEWCSEFNKNIEQCGAGCICVRISPVVRVARCWTLPRVFTSRRDNWSWSWRLDPVTSRCHQMQQG